MFSKLKSLSVINFVVICFVISNCVLAITDKNYRVNFKNLSGMAITGFLAQLKAES